MNILKLAGISFSYVLAFSNFSNLQAHTVEEYQATEFIEPSIGLQNHATKDRPDRIIRTKQCLEDKRNKENELVRVEGNVQADNEAVRVSQIYHNSWNAFVNELKQSKNISEFKVADAPVKADIERLSSEIKTYLVQSDEAILATINLAKQGGKPTVAAIAKIKALETFLLLKRKVPGKDSNTLINEIIQIPQNDIPLNDAIKAHLTNNEIELNAIGLPLLTALIQTQNGPYSSFLDNLEKDIKELLQNTNNRLIAAGSELAANIAKRDFDISWRENVKQQKESISAQCRLFIMGLTFIYDSNRFNRSDENFHYQKLLGLGEGFQVLFNSYYYSLNYPDFYFDASNWSDNRLKNIWAHYQWYGTRDGLRGSLFFEPNYYLAKNGDVLAQCQKQKKETITKCATIHFRTDGLAEFREASPDFNVRIYRDRYVDVRGVCRNSAFCYYAHYMANGIFEGRSGI